MTPQGSSLVDTQWFDNAIAQAVRINVCAELQAFANEVMASIQANVSAVEGQIENLLPLKALLDLPTDLPSVLTWIEKLVAAQIQPGYNAYLNYVEQLAQLVAKIGQLTAAIAAAAARIGSCAAAAPALVLTSAAGQAPQGATGAA